MHLKDENGMANRVDPNLTAPLGAVRFGSILFFSDLFVPILRTFFCNASSLGSKERDNIVSYY